MRCEIDLANEDVTELIVAKDEADAPDIAPDCIVAVNEKYQIWYYKGEEFALTSVLQYSYESIPQCYVLCDMQQVEETQIADLQNISTLSLKGQGVFLAILDTGIRYEDRAFRDTKGESRIYAMWDQTEVWEEETEGEGIAGEEIAGVGTAGEGLPGVPYGRVYGRSLINQALFSQTPEAVVRERDENGHGSFLASVAAGSLDEPGGFVGAAPMAELLVVKLRPAKEKLKQFYGIPRDTVCYGEADLMLALSWVNRVAEAGRKPLVVLLGVGTSQGSHAGSGPLCDYLDSLTVQLRKCMVAVTGNEAGARRHYYGRADSPTWPLRIELNVEKQMPTLCLELWTMAPSLLQVAVQSPTGERYPQSGSFLEPFGAHTFLPESTELAVATLYVGRARRDQLIFLRFTNITAGIWTILVYPGGFVPMDFHIWLPATTMTEGQVNFLEADPQTTLLGPSDAHNLISVGGCTLSGNLYTESGRGYTADDFVKPELLAPGVGVQGKNQWGQYEVRTGTSGAGALVAGACAQLLEWAVVRANRPLVNGVDLKNALIRGAKRREEEEYPSPARGYGELNVYEALRNL